MARTQTLVQLNDDLVAQLDAEAERQCKSRSAVIRSAIVEYLQRESEQEKVRQYVEGYRRLPQGESDEWGDVGEFSDRNSRDVMRSLDAEEEAAGLTW